MRFALLFFGILNGFPMAEKAFDAAHAPTDNYYSEIADADSIKANGQTNDSLQVSVKIPEKEISSLEYLPSLEEKMPTMVEIMNFSSTVSVYRANDDIVEIKKALDTYFEGVHDTNAVGKITFYYKDEKLIIYVGDEFFDIYN